MSKIFNRFGRPSGLSLVGAIALGAMSTSALAQEWKAVVLDAPGSVYSIVTGVWGNVSVGEAQFGSQLHAMMWSDTSAIDLKPSFAGRSSALAVFGDQQVGVVHLNEFIFHAALWNGSAASFVDLNPPGISHSIIRGTCGTQQGGGIYYASGDIHAAMWSGSAASVIDLHPSFAYGSFAYAMGDGQQVGSVKVNDPIIGPEHASVWRGSAASCVDLHPANSGGQNESTATAVSGDHQVGWVTPNLGGIRAVMWSGTAASMVDLTPPGHTGMALGGTNGFQVGWVDGRAALWSGTAESYVDLSASLPADMTSYSEANSAWTNGRTIVVGGYAVSALDHARHAVRWIAGESCPADFDGDGALDFFDYDAFVVCFEGSCPQGRTADFDGDGSVDFNDYDAFVVAFEDGC